MQNLTLGGGAGRREGASKPLRVFFENLKFTHPPPRFWPVLLFEFHSNLNTGLLTEGVPPWLSGEVQASPETHPLGLEPYIV